MPQTILRAERVEKYYAQPSANRIQVIAPTDLAVWRRLYWLAETRYNLEG
jgi:hypothetical protein